MSSPMLDEAEAVVDEAVQDEAARLPMLDEAIQDEAVRLSRL